MLNSPHAHAPLVCFVSKFQDWLLETHLMFKTLPSVTHASSENCLELMTTVALTKNNQRRNKFDKHRFSHCREQVLLPHTHKIREKLDKVQCADFQETQEVRTDLTCAL